MATEGVDSLGGAYLYTFPNMRSYPGFLRQGWEVKRKVPITVHTVSGALKNYRNVDVIPEEFAEWRFTMRPAKEYYICRSDGQIFLLTMRRENCYAVGGRLSGDLGLKEVKPRFLLSYDFPNKMLTVPRHQAWQLENTSSQSHTEFIFGYRSDGW